MFKKILVANRGEIAVRIIRTAREMGIKTVAIYSEADKDALHTHLADEAFCIGPANAKYSYLNISAILNVVCLTGADALHPGFGFLSENSKFASRCEEVGCKFIGPNSNMIDKMGNKSMARKIMIDAGVPVVPGSNGSVDDMSQVLKIAKQIQYPIMLKASSGGGGRGMRLAYSESELKEAFKTAKAEAKACFGDDSMYIEKFIENPRHVEFQILADKYGNTVYLGERDCSIQRRNQKVLEEAPSSILTEDLRRKMGEAAVLAARSVNYENAGTVEFLVDKHRNFYFIEMNTRIQVEHPVTEMITDIDLIKKQIEIASGKPLNLKQEDIKITGHSIECRINAENPKQNFRPSPGYIESFHLPGGFGVRVDTAIYQGYKIPINYDSMIAKLIVHGKTREEAIKRMNRALFELTINGIDTNIEFLSQIITNKKFLSNDYDTSFIEKLLSKKNG